MNRNNSIDLMEYLSLALVLSFFLLHNIHIVFLGMITALFTINKKYLYRIIKFNQIEKFNKKVEVETLISKESKSKDSYREDSIITLAETIEELGFIPSPEKSNDSHAA